MPSLKCNFQGTQFNPGHGGPPADAPLVLSVLPRPLRTLYQKICPCCAQPSLPESSPGRRPPPLSPLLLQLFSGASSALTLPTAARGLSLQPCTCALNCLWSQAPASLPGPPPGPLSSLVPGSLSCGLDPPNTVALQPPAQMSWTSPSRGQSPSSLAKDPSLVPMAPLQGLPRQCVCRALPEAGTTGPLPQGLLAQPTPMRPIPSRIGRVTFLLQKASSCPEP